MREADKVGTLVPRSDRVQIERGETASWHEC
jgi:hypothetical protein